MVNTRFTKIEEEVSKVHSAPESDRCQALKDLTSEMNSLESIIKGIAQDGDATASKATLSTALATLKNNGLRDAFPSRY